MTYTIITESHKSVLTDLLAKRQTQHLSTSTSLAKQSSLCLFAFHVFYKHPRKLKEISFSYALTLCFLFRRKSVERQYACHDVMPRDTIHVTGKYAYIK